MGSVDTERANCLEDAAFVKSFKISVRPALNAAFDVVKPHQRAWIADEKFSVDVVVDVVVEALAAALEQGRDEKIDLADLWSACCEVVPYLCHACFRDFGDDATEMFRRLELPRITDLMDRARAKADSHVGMDNVTKESFKNYWEFFGDLKIHATMLQDESRMNAYHNAISKNADSYKDKVVMDLGAGTGILGFWALRAGAKHVYAVEASGMVEVIEELARENGFEDRLTIVHSVLQDVTFDQIPENGCDIILSETLSTVIFNEKGMETLFVARDRFLKKDGILLPDSATLYIAPFSDAKVHEKHGEVYEMWQQKNYYGIDFTSLAERHQTEEYATTVTDMIDPQVLVADAYAHTWDFKTMTLEDLNRIVVNYTCAAKKTSIVHGLATWFNITLGGPEHVENLCTGPNSEWTHWWQCRFLIREPLAVNQNQKLEGVFTMTCNEKMSYDTSLVMSIAGHADTIRNGRHYDLGNRDSSYQRCVKYNGRVFGVPHNRDTNDIPEYVKKVRPGVSMTPSKV